ncbi:levansucrase [Ameyamaea chiangmaiensis NBRC 103196]|uniref:Glycoside hydrolase family 68 protein n=1 Tax=Ameyamaea chiangmaiensis TaxID=442969 RepID=A0A850PC40_9PROT|nr:glycoside hydrolase family 68 protein [Ameyamaea chiangmaiensis]MBS4075377.1 glycoside hydrolase family 68 protein [Ameyamaea chiangmaiensis]NVN39866.1 glycoside hydrolase family 68 protein [Ameyamaea chiangmaiensis]GBQ69977.1 levansucrase [Ameyamaea chiangmaiensis NBRC 103196]
MNAISTSRWRIADALKVHADDATTTMPVIAYDFPTMDESVLIWDTGALRSIHGQTVTFKGWHVIWSLAVEKQDLTNQNIVSEWRNRNNSAFIGYWYSRDGVEWTWGGRLLQKTADLRPWEWSGGLVMRDESANTVDMFYTSCGYAGANETDFQSVISVSTGTIHADDKGVWFEGFDATTEMFQADGVNYANAEEDPYWDFRDPHPFINPADGKLYCLFEGNVAGMRGAFSISGPEMGPVPPGFEVGTGAQYGAAAIGIARLDSDYHAGDFTKWTMLPPLVTALGVNDQTERPHVVFKNGLTYLFTISHHSTYTGGLEGPDGVYGFVSDKGVFGPYRPLNASGLVLGNPSSAPYQTYSHFVDPDGYVQSFIDTVPAANNDPDNPAVYRIGGTLAPTVRIAFEGDRTFVTEVHGYGQIFAQAAWPVAATPDPRS